MASGAFWAFGSQFKIGDDGSTETFTKVAEIIDINGPGLSRDVIEVTSQDSTNGWKEFLPGLRDGGEINITANWDPDHATQDGTTGILSKFNDDELHNWQIITPSGAGVDIDFAAFVTAMNLSFPVAEKGILECTLKISGAVTVSPST